MIANPYICTAGPRAGSIEWFDDSDGFRCSSEEPWKPYADFEREKLRELGFGGIYIGMFCGKPRWLLVGDGHRRQKHPFCHTEFYATYFTDSESSRLLKRAEFLRAVCERENVLWLPKIHWLCCGLERDKPCNDEREWRRALLDFLATSPWAGTYKIKDLRSRFL